MYITLSLSNRLLLIFTSWQNETMFLISRGREERREMENEKMEEGEGEREVCLLLWLH